MNARFWMYWNDGFVRLTLRPHQEIVLAYGGPTDEGYARHAEIYRHCGDSVECEVHDEYRDCDGPGERHWYGFARLDNLDTMPADTHGPDRPQWEKICENQRDRYAEAMNY